MSSYPDPIQALRARYAGDMPLERAPRTWSPALDLLLSHRSVRDLTGEPLDADLLPTLVAAAQSASTSSGLQTWSVVAVEDSARKTRLAALAGGQRHIVEAPLILVWLADLARLHGMGERGAKPTEALDYTEAFLVACIDAALAAQNAAVAAESLGLGVVYIGALRNHPETVAAELKLPARVFPIFGLCVGRIDESCEAAVKPRLPQDVVLHREAYDAEGVAASIARYDEATLAFKAQQKMPLQTWSAQMLGRMAGPASMSGRDRLKDAIRALGFPLR
jgi:nitroreductase